MSTISTITKLLIEIMPMYFKKRKKIRDLIIGNEMKLSLFLHDMMVYLKNAREPKVKLIQIVTYLVKRQDLKLMCKNQ